MYSQHGSVPKITNINFTDGSIELSHIFRPDVKQFTISARNSQKFLFSYEENGTSSNYMTIPENAVYYETYIKDTLTIYFLVPNASEESPETLEILEWMSED